MSEQKSQLNGAYYGPAVPPPKQRRMYHRLGGSGSGGSGSGGGGCGCCGCLLNCIFGCICQLLCAILIFIGVVVLALWFVLRPNNVKFHVTHASLTQFDYINDTLHYNLALNVNIRNPNRRIGIYYDSTEADVLFLDQRFSTQDLTPFYQGHKNTQVLSPVFQGQQSLFLSRHDVSQFDKDKSNGVFHIQLKLHLSIRLKVLIFKSGKFKPKISCYLEVPLTTDGTRSGQFETTLCLLDF